MRLGPPPSGRCQVWASLHAEGMRAWATLGSQGWSRDALLDAARGTTAARGRGQLLEQAWKHWNEDGCIGCRPGEGGGGGGGGGEGRVLSNAAAHLRCPARCAQLPGSSALGMSAGQAQKRLCWPSLLLLDARRQCHRTPTLTSPRKPCQPCMCKQAPSCSDRPCVVS